MFEIYSAPSEEIAAGFRAKQVTSIVRMTPICIAANLLNVLVVLHALRGYGATTSLAVWAVASVLILGYGAYGWLQSRRRTGTLRASPRTLRAILRNAVVLGLVWAVVPAMYYGRDDGDAALLISLVSAGSLLGGAFVLATVPRAAIAYVGIVLFGCLVALFRDGVERNIDLILLLLIYAGIAMATIFSSARSFGARLMAEAEAQRQKELVGLLLKDFESNASDWLWETDSSGQLRHVSDRMRQMFGLREDASLGDVTLPEMLRRMSGDGQTGESAIRRLEAGLNSPAPFRDMTVSVEHDGVAHWWSLTATPLFNGAGRHVGWRGVGSDISERRRAMAELSRQANTDSLTGLANRHALHQRLETLTSRKPQLPFALLCFDLDNFKNVNDSLGHSAGDLLLKEVAARLRTAASAADTIARLGGDEFAVICPGPLTPEVAGQHAQRLLDSLRAPFELEGRTLHVASSIGIAIFPQQGETVDALIRNADMALYSAKAAGRSTWSIFHEDMSARARKRLALQSDLLRALQEKQIEVHYQPQIDMATGVVRGFEALARWRHPQHGLVPPGHFIPLAEECGLIVQLGGLVLREACLEASRWPCNAIVAVNVSAAQFSRSSVLQEVKDALEASGLAPQRLEIEVTESVLIDDDAVALNTLVELRALGVGLALDDFGTGYSSLAYLRDYPLTKLKIDRSFVSTLGSDRSTVAIVRSIMLLAGELKLDVVAEGIETGSEHDALFALGCRTGQGYLFSPPIPATELMGYIEKMNRRRTGCDDETAESEPLQLNGEPGSEFRRA